MNSFIKFGKRVLRFFNLNLDPKPKIKAFIITFNEAPIISLTIKHYQRFCSDIYIYDNFSTDRTVEICRSLGCHVENFGIQGVLDDRTYLEIKNNVWKNHRDADYVIVCDSDEIINLPKPLEFDVYQTTGYHMYSETMPSSWDKIKQGFPDTAYDKILLFNPKKIKEINYSFGCHSTHLETMDESLPISIDRGTVVLRHMRYIGGVERMIERYQLYATRMSDFNKENLFGYQYQHEVEKIKNNWNEVKQKAKKIKYNH